MSNFAPPVERDGFVYHGQLFADVGNLNRHPRASEPELNALLRPKKSTKDTKDQVGHWYVAQLKHYGLPQTKDKNTAKIRLLTALNTGNLKVPADVKKLEAALKKEYDAANRKAKSEMKGKAPEPDTTTTTPARKRKDKAPAPTATTTPAKKRKEKSPAPDTTTTTPAKKRKRAGEDDAVPATQPASAKKTKQAEPAKRKEPAEKKMPAEKKTPAKKKEPAKKTPATPKSRVAAAPQRKSTAASTVKKPTYAFSDKKGVYYLTIPIMATELPADPKSLKMLLCPDGNKLWGSYNFGPFSGVFLLDEEPRDGTFAFVWRGTDTSDPSRVKFATGLGDMNFVDAKRIDGAFYNLGQYRTRFEGKVQAGVRQCPRDALSFEHEWDDYGHTNNWFGRPDVRIPAGEKPPPGSFAGSSTLDALNPAKPRYFPVDGPQDTPPMEEQNIKDDPDLPRHDSGPSFVNSPEDTPSTENQSIKDEADLQAYDAGPSSVNRTARRTSYIQSTDGFYNNSPSATHSRRELADIGQVTGVYDIQCPAIEDDFLECQNNLKLFLCRDTRSPKTWGSFAWGPFCGVIQMNPGPADYSRNSVTLGWRARDEETGGIRFGRGCHGEMEFPEPGSIGGRLFGLHGGVMEFWGRRRPGPKNCGYALNQFQEEWNSYPSEVYGQPEGSESDNDLYDRNGNLIERRYSSLLERARRG